MDNTYQIAQNLFSNDYFKMVLRDQVQVICQKIILKHQKLHINSEINDKLDLTFQNPQHIQRRPSIETQTLNYEQISQKSSLLAQNNILKQTNAFYQLICLKLQQNFQNCQNKLDQFIKNKTIQIQELIKTLKAQNHQQQDLKQRKSKLNESKQLIERSLTNLHQKQLAYSTALPQGLYSQYNFDEKSQVQSINQESFFEFSNFQFQKNEQFKNVFITQKNEKTEKIQKTTRQLDQFKKATKKQLNNQNQNLQTTNNDFKKLEQSLIGIKRQKVDERFSETCNKVGLLEKKSPYQNKLSNITMQISECHKLQ